MLIHTTFEELNGYGTKAGKCAGCGSQAQRSKSFYQTLNSFNRTAEGKVKTREVIREELDAAVYVWESEPVFHKKCESN